MVTHNSVFEIHPSCIIVHFFLMLNISPLYGYTTVCLPSYLLKDIWVAFNFFTITNKTIIIRWAPG